MITINDVILRNLEEQVLKNQNDILDIVTAQKTLNELGIKVVGQVETTDKLPDPATYEGEYGDAYAVGTQTPYFYYIFTRPNEQHPISLWFNVGKFPMPGPQGPQGIQGPQGAIGVGSKWYASNRDPSGSDYQDNDQWLNTLTGNVFSFKSGIWSIQGSIQGPQGVQGPQGIQGPQGVQGPQGIQGPQGDVGGFININGILESTASLPTPASLGDLTKAYLIGTQSPYELYIQVGSTSATAVWTNVGYLNIGTYVTVDGNYVNVLEMNTYQKAIKSVTLNSPSTATSGNITSEQLATLQADQSNVVIFNNEVYRQCGNGHTNGVLDYSTVDNESGEIISKTISINIANLSWVLRTQSKKANADASNLTDENVTNWQNKVGTKLLYQNYVYTEGRAGQPTLSLISGNININTNNIIVFVNAVWNVESYTAKYYVRIGEKLYQSGQEYNSISGKTAKSMLLYCTDVPQGAQTFEIYVESHQGGRIAEPAYNFPYVCIISV